MVWMVSSFMYAKIGLNRSRGTCDFSAVQDYSALLQSGLDPTNYPRNVRLYVRVSFKNNAW